MKRVFMAFLCPLCISCGAAHTEQLAEEPKPEVLAENVENENANDAEEAYALRLEVPHLRGGSSLFLTKTVPVFGVNYSLEFDCGLRSTRWVAYRWDAANSVKEDFKRSEAWREDSEIPAAYRVTLDDHKNDDYDRGHLLSSDERKNSLEANKQTFLLSNILPQYNKFNSSRYVWWNMEDYCRTMREQLVSEDYPGDTVYVVKGGTIDSESQILERSVKNLIVPKYFYMAFLWRSVCSGEPVYEAMAFWVEHTNGKDRTSGQDLKKYVVTIDELERLTGIDFYCNLPDDIEARVESVVHYEPWGFE